MQIACPNCTTSYEIAASALGKTGRMVRCTHCSQQWFAQVPEFENAVADSGPARLEDDPRESRFENSRRDDSRFDVDPYAAGARDPGYDAAPAGWADPAAQWSVEQTDPEDIVQFVSNDDEVEFAPPRDIDAIDAIDDAPALAPGRYGEDDAGAAVADMPESAVAEDGAAPDYFELQRRRKTRAQPQAGRGPLITMPRLIAALAAVIVGLIFERGNIVRLMPQTAALYAAIGMPINLRGLVFEDVKSTTEMQDSIPVLVIEGSIRNITRDNAEVPRLRFAMRNSAGADIYSWTAVPDRTLIAPGTVLSFRTRLASPPSESRGAYVRFMQRRDLVNNSP